jgi:hypothetical protein
VNGLPREAATFRDHIGWDAQTELTASLIEVMDRWARQFGVWKGVKQRHLPKPVRIFRPGEEQQQKVESDPRAIAAFFRKHIGGRG